MDARAPREYEGTTAIAVCRIVAMLVRMVGLAALLALAGCGGDAEEVGAPVLEEPAIYIAFARDFERFERWTTFDRGRDPVPPSHLGPSLIYVTPAPPERAEAFPVGTRIVRVERAGEDPAAWEVHAMVKRGGGFNEAGAAGWEFFELSLASSRERPEIRWRGEGPANGDGYVAPEGGEVLGCNHCHASATYNDSVLSPVLQLSALAPR